MRIQVIKILSGPSIPPWVEFQSAYGIGRARWAEGLPRLFQDYDVEFEIPETLIRGQTLVPHAEELMAVAYQEDALLLAGRLESVAEDGTGYVRVGTSLLLIDVEMRTASNLVPCFVRIVSKQAILYDTRI